MELKELTLSSIEPDPSQPRQDFSDLDMLTESIRTQGVFVPIIVRPLVSDRYCIIAGERRWRASQQAGKETIPALVSSLTSDEEIRTVQLIENLQRKGLNPFEEARAIDQLLETKQITAEALAKSIGMTPSNISQIRSILRVEKEIPLALQTSESFTSSKSVLIEIAKKKDEPVRKELINRMLQNNLTVREARGYRGAYQSRIQTRNYCDSHIKIILRTTEGAIFADESKALEKSIDILKAALEKLRKSELQRIDSPGTTQESNAEVNL